MSFWKFAATALLILFVGSYVSADLVINEIANGNGGVSNGFDADEAIEILLTTSYTAAELDGLWFGDSTGSTADKFSQWQIGDLSSIGLTFNAGTILVVAGDSFTQNTSYNPVVGGSDDDWSILLTAGGGFISETDPPSDGDLAVGGSGDVIWVDFDNMGDTDFVVNHAVGWDTGTDGAFLTSGGNVVNAGFTSSVSTGDFVAFTGGAGDILNSSSFVDNGMSGSIGSANGGDNTTYINSLRVPEPTTFAMFGIAISAVGFRRRK